MNGFTSLLMVTHLIGLALGVGAATAKMVLLIRCNSDLSLVPVYLRVTRPLTRQLVLGIILLTLSGIGWLLLGYPLKPLLVVKLVLAAAIWVLGPLIDNVFEPRFQRLAPAPGTPASVEFHRVQRQHLTLEIVATGLFYLIIVMWVMLS